ncbi:MAG TPA: CusA/CzcA family heavy metal efflux RND transporter [Bacteroidia bacterium]|jgi:cobalt-zinc-cadmium resistance protein CzcA|nr:CusA/CzcA family heavy metal efflux RND transporter [Bacteroidia bacterium]
MNNLVKGILSFSLKNKFFVLVATIITVIAGIIAYLDTPIEAFPDVTNTQIIVITQWPGRSAEEIEKFVTIPIEIALNPSQKKTSIRSTTLFGLSVVKVIFDDDVDDAFARQQVNNLLRNVDLPDGVNSEIEPPYGPTGEIFRYTVDSKTLGVRALKTIQDWVIERNLKSVPGIADVVSFGGEVKTYEIIVRPTLLTKYDITPLEVYQAVSKSNINVGGDVIQKNNQAYVVRGIGLLTSISDIENIIIDYADGVPVLVKNVASVKESALPRLGQVGRDTANDVVEGIVVMRKGENPGAVISRLNLKIEELNDKILTGDVQIKTFYNREDLIHFCTHTVIHNLLEGIIFVTVIVFLFMADWRTTVIVGVIIPLSLLFAFICLRLKGMTANLLSMGAVDFGIIIDGAVVMVEGVFVVLDHKAEKIGMERYNKLSKLGLIRKNGVETGKAILFSQLIIISCLLPIFSFEKVEGKMFSPLAFTLGFALLGALIFTVFLVPVLISFLLNKNVKEKHNILVEFITRNVIRIFNKLHKVRKTSITIAAIIMAVGLFMFHFLGSEFLPQLNEGSIYVRANMPLSISLSESVKLSNKMRRVFMQFAEVKQVISQAGRPNDGTDPTGFYNVEFHVDLLQKDEWKRKISKAELITEMQDSLDAFSGINFNFSQPIMDNVEEAVSGVKGSIAVKVYGDDMPSIEGRAKQIEGILNTVTGIEDLAVIRNIGQPELRIELDEVKMAQFGVTTADCNAVIEMAIGGKAVTQFYDGFKKFDVRIRFSKEYRKTETEIADVLVPSIHGIKIPLKEIAKIYTVTGPLLIFHDDTKRFCAVKFSVRGRDMGSTIDEAQKKVSATIKSLPKGQSILWCGDFENQQRAQKRLMHVVPITILLIFIILFGLFGNFSDASLLLLNIPFGLVGGILALMITGVNFSISAGIGFIALMGVCIQNGVILMSVFKKHITDDNMTVTEAVKKGVAARVRPVVMTATIAIIGLLPAATSTGIGSESSKPLAIVVIGGLSLATVSTLLIFPLIFESIYQRKYHRKSRKSAL